MPPTLNRVDGSLMKYVGLSYPTIYKMEKAGKFPARRQPTPNRVFWLTAEVDEWLKNLPKAA